MTLGRMRGEYKMPHGLFFKSEFITEEQEHLLLDVISKIAFEEVIMHDQVARRKVKSYGFDYEFGFRSVKPGEPIPSELFWLRDACAKFAELSPDAIAECLVSQYPTKATIGWHRDLFAYGSKVMGISLLSPCIMRFQRVKDGKRQVYELELPPRSAYILSGQARYTWQHSIPAIKNPRYSITFRTLKDTNSKL